MMIEIDKINQTHAGRRNDFGLGGLDWLDPTFLVFNHKVRSLCRLLPAPAAPDSPPHFLHVPDAYFCSCSLARGG